MQFSKLNSPNKYVKFKLWEIETYFEHRRGVSEHHIHILCFSVLLKNGGTFKRNDVIVSANTEHINRVRKQAIRSRISQFLPHRSLHLLEIPKLSFNVYRLKIKSTQSIFSIEKERSRKRQNNAVWSIGEWYKSSVSFDQSAASTRCKINSMDVEFVARI